MGASSTRQSSLSFGLFNVDLASGQLFRRGQKVALQEKPWGSLRGVETRCNSAGWWTASAPVCRSLWSGWSESSVVPQRQGPAVRGHTKRSLQSVGAAPVGRKAKAVHRIYLGPDFRLQLDPRPHAPPSHAWQRKPRCRSPASSDRSIMVPHSWPNLPKVGFFRRAKAKGALTV